MRKQGKKGICDLCEDDYIKQSGNQRFCLECSIKLSHSKYSRKREDCIMELLQNDRALKQKRLANIAQRIKKNRRLEYDTLPKNKQFIQTNGV